VVFLAARDVHRLAGEDIAKTVVRHRLSDFERVGEADDGKQAVDMALELLHEIMIIDIGMPVLNGIEATKQILKTTSKIKIIALSMHNDKHFVVGMFKAGAIGYLLKDCAFEELIKAIYTVKKGNYYLSREINNVVISDFSGNLENLIWANENNLSEREIEVLQMIVDGNSTKVIADKLGLSAKTIEAHRKNIMNKLNLFTIPELTKYALKMGFTSL